MISFEPSDDEQAIREEVHKFAEQELRKRGRECEKSHRVPDELHAAVHALGLATLDWPESLGGAGLSPVARAIVDEELAWGDAGLAVALDGPGSAAIAIEELGTEEQRAALLPRLAGSGRVAALGLAEGDLGSELGHVAATATPNGGGYRLSGRKLFVWNAPDAELFVFFARVAGAPAGGPPAAFVVERGARGLVLEKDDDRIGLQAARSCAVRLEDVLVPGDSSLGAAGAAQLDRFLARSWLRTAARSVGVARAAVEYSTFYAQDRSAFGRKIGTFQGIAFKVADMAMETDSARWLVWKAAANLAKGRDVTRDAALACVHANETAVRAAIECVQILGGAGFMEDYPAEKWMREARALAAIGGVDAVRNHLAAEREYGPEIGEPAPDPSAAFASFGSAFGS